MKASPTRPLLGPVRRPSRDAADRRSSASESSRCRPSSTGWRRAASTPVAATSSTWPTRSCTAGRGCDSSLGPNDVIVIDGRALRPVRAVPGGRADAARRADRAAAGGPASNPASTPRWPPAPSGSAGGWSAGSASARLVDRLWLILLFGFSTQILWVTTRGGVWHTGHLIATHPDARLPHRAVGPTAAAPVGLLAGAAFLTRAPVAFAIPFYALLLGPDRRPPSRACRWTSATMSPGRRATCRGGAGCGWAGVLPSIVGFFAYNDVRFGDPLESGYALATLPPFLDELREQGLFSLVHVGMNLEYFLIDLPKIDPRLPVLPPRRPRDVRAADEPGPPVRDPRRLAPGAELATGGATIAVLDPDSALLRGWMAAVRLPLLPRLRAVRHRALWPRGRPAGAACPGPGACSSSSASVVMAFWAYQL